MRSQFGAKVRVHVMRAAIAAAALLCLAGIWLAWHADIEAGVVPMPAQGNQRSHTQGQGLGDAHIEGAAQAVTMRTAAQVRASVIENGSLKGTTPSGDWCVQGGVLRPCEGLRGRFEYYLLGMGEARIEELRLLIEDEAARAHGGKLAAQIMSVFDRYWQLRTHAWRYRFVQGDRATWMPVFEEQRAVRRQLLGQAWAEAFFGAEEAQFLSYYRQLESGLPRPPDPGEPVRLPLPGVDPVEARSERVARYGEAAAARLEEVDAKWAEWERRLASARTEWRRVQTAEHLSEPQKKAEMDRYVDAHFQGKEQLRVRALLQLP